VKYGSALMIAAAALGCDPVITSGLVLRPAPALSADSVIRSTHALTSAIGQRHGLKPLTTRGKAEAKWYQCLDRLGFTLCWKPTEGGAIFLLSDGPPKSGLAGPVRYELSEGLKQLFGVAAVRDCEWRWDGATKREECAVLARGP
jgi:hypothetical protein